MTCCLCWVVNLTVSLTAKHHKHCKDLCSILVDFSKINFIQRLSNFAFHIYITMMMALAITHCVLNLFDFICRLFKFDMYLIFNSVQGILSRIVFVYLSSNSGFELNGHLHSSNTLISLVRKLFISPFIGVSKLVYCALETKSVEFQFKIFSSPV